MRSLSALLRDGRRESPGLMDAVRQPVAPPTPGGSGAGPADSPRSTAAADLSSLVSPRPRDILSPVRLPPSSPLPDMAVLTSPTPPPLPTPLPMQSPSGVALSASRAGRSVDRSSMSAHDAQVAIQNMEEALKAERILRLEFAQGAELLCSSLCEAGILSDAAQWAGDSWEALAAPPSQDHSSPLRESTLHRKYLGSAESGGGGSGAEDNEHALPAALRLDQQQQPQHQQQSQQQQQQQQQTTPNRASLPGRRYGQVKLRFLALARAVRREFDARQMAAAAHVAPAAAAAAPATPPPDADGEATVRGVTAAEVRRAVADAVAAVGGVAGAALVDALVPRLCAALRQRERGTDESAALAVTEGVVLPDSAAAAAAADHLPAHEPAGADSATVSVTPPRTPTRQAVSAPSTPSGSAATPLARLERRLREFSLPASPGADESPADLQARNAALRRELLSMREQMERAVGGARTERLSLRAALAELADEAARLQSALQRARSERDVLLEQQQQRASPVAGTPAAVAGGAQRAELSAS